MVKIKRTYTPKELSKTNKAFKAAIEGMSTKEAYRFYVAHAKRYCYNTPETKRHFRKMNHERCSFCTMMIHDFEDAMEVEHIKTKKDCPEKIFQWSNMLCACHTCNNKRGTRVHIPEKYLDPTKTDEIENYFCYEPDGTVAADEELCEDDRKKAAYMIKLYELNRKELVCKRREFLADLMTDDDYYEKLEKVGESSQNIIFLSVFVYYKKCKTASYNQNQRSKNEAFPGRQEPL